jgi:hypothetical protein
MTARYNDMIGGQYLAARFGFTFVEPATPEIQAVQDALFNHAAEVARWRTGLRNLMRSMVEDFGFMTKSLEDGNLYAPLGDGPARDPYAAARRIEHEENILLAWVKAVGVLQAAPK